MVLIVQVHVGQELPDYIIDCVYQNLLVHYYSAQIYMILSDNLIQEFNKRISNFSFPIKNEFLYLNQIVVIPASILKTELEKDQNYKDYKKKVTTYGLESFRDSFWISTTSRFFYIKECYKLFFRDRKDIFHIENDVMVYYSLDDVLQYTSIAAKEARAEREKEREEEEKEREKEREKEKVKKRGRKSTKSAKEEKKEEDEAKNEAKNEAKCEVVMSTSEMSTSAASRGIYMIKDSEARVIPSVMCFTDYEQAEDLVKHITSTIIESPVFINDMNILVTYKGLLQWPHHPEDSSPIIFDGAAIGQYLGGVDPKNIPDYTDPLSNPRTGFINETCDFDTSKYSLEKKYTDNLSHVAVPFKYYTLNGRIIINLHIHSKQLFRFSSIFDVDYDDIITGDRLVDGCDIVITNSEIDKFHKGIKNKNKIILDKMDDDTMIKQIKKTIKKENKENIKVFVYTHIFNDAEAFFNKLDAATVNKLVLYCHNSDHPFNYETVCKLVFTTNLDSDASGYYMFPIGIANAMWPHGNLVDLYTVMKNTYNMKKTGHIYINFDTSTFPYRKEIMDQLVSEGQFPICSNKSYKEYLMELSTYRYGFCIRGNGLDTHRFWECLYLNVVPIILNNEHTKLDKFLKGLRKFKIPFMEIKDISELKKFPQRGVFYIASDTKEYLKFNTFYGLID
jgi:hypothetical protein